MARPPKKPDVFSPPAGVEEARSEFEGVVGDRWAIARARLAEHDRTGAGTMTVDEAMAELTAMIEQRQASKT